MKEIFKAVQGYEELYQVSNFGRVKSLPRQKSYGKGTFLTEERFLRQRIHIGYLRVNLCEGSAKMKTINVHILVANAFHEKIEDKPFANHKDLNRLNNHADNLEWVNRRENTSHQKGIKGTIHTYRYVYSADNKLNPFGAKLKIDGKTKYLGCHKTALAAHKAALDYIAKNNIINKYI